MHERKGVRVIANAGSTVSNLPLPSTPARGASNGRAMSGRRERARPESDEVARPRRAPEERGRAEKKRKADAVVVEDWEEPRKAEKGLRRKVTADTRCEGAQGANGCFWMSLGQP